jgi:1-phosphatidylinositol-3-phosphate 5-kinase
MSSAPGAGADTTNQEFKKPSLPRPSRRQSETGAARKTVNENNSGNQGSREQPVSLPVTPLNGNDKQLGLGVYSQGHGGPSGAVDMKKISASKRPASRTRARPALDRLPSDWMSGNPEGIAAFRAKLNDRLAHPVEMRLRDPDLIKLRKGESSNKARVATLAKHFEQISKEFELARARERDQLDLGRYRALPVAVSRPIVDVFKNVEEAVEEMSDDESVEISDNSSGDEVQVDTDGSRTDVNATAAEGKLEILKDSAESPQEPELRSAVALESVTVKPEIAPSLANEKQSLVQTLANFWADRSATGWGPLKYPLSHSEHMFSDSDIIIREDEPSSLIAFCLSSKDYLDRVNDQKMKDETSKASSGLANFKGDSDLEKRMLKKTALHLRYQFQESSARFSCKVFYSEQFDAIRKFCDCDEYYIQSLARCAKWESNGGKSGSAFLKTLDDRLVMKELSPIELEAFVKFAPSYFEYMAEAFFHELPTVLAKILGLYSVQIRNPLTGNVMKLDVIVMENLFYNRKMSRIFDLKGSMRNRHVQQTGREDEVLLDENMVEYIYESPLFTRDHAKRFLKTSLFNDTLFLAKMNVMDYSLVIGLDKENKQLVVGIIGKQPCVEIPSLVGSLAN